MSRGQGRVYRQKGSQNWFYDFSVDGKRYQGTTETPEKRAAQAILTEQRAAALKGRAPGLTSRKVTVHDLRKLAVDQYVLDERRSKPRYGRAWDHLERLISPETRVSHLTALRRDDYTRRRMEEKASRATINYELGALRRGERLAVEKGVLGGALLYRLPKPKNARRGFFEDGEIGLMLLELADYLRPVVRFAAATGWRITDEILPLQWDLNVDWEGKLIRLWSGTTKSGEPRQFPFGMAPELDQMMSELYQHRDGPYVFHRHGQQIIDYSTAWENACRRAGIQRIPHDLRRTAARNFRRAGVSENVIMDLCGWKTRDVFDRYDIRNEKDLAEAVAQRFAQRQSNGIVGGVPSNSA
jgi:integrase